MQGQNGFRALKSCRDAVFQLWREMEKSNKANEAFMLTFIDYSKAFDSLDWAKLWDILEFAGCPRGIVTVIKSLYEHSTISIRITADGELAPRFKHKCGIRQGSSLSPCLFVLAMDFCLRVFQEACTDMGLPSHEGTWTAYADDIADKSLGEEEATEALQQLEAASAFVGLRLNIPKTEVMAKGINRARESSDKPASKERVAVKMDGRHGDDHLGWILEERHAHFMGIKVERTAFMERPMLVVFDTGHHLSFDDRGQSWLRDENGLSYRFTRLGFECFLDKTSKRKFLCEGCQTSFDSELALKIHRGGGWCRRFEDLAVREQTILRRTRVNSSTKRGKSSSRVEVVEVLTCEGKETKSCGEFVYLGSKIITSASATPEIKRRIGMAQASFGKLWRIWRSKKISTRLKPALYRAIVLSIMLYNAEVWPIRERDLKSLEGAHFRMMRSMVADGAEDEHITKEHLLETLGMASVADIITTKRLRWVGHALRRHDRDRSRIAVMNELKDTSSTWTKLVMQDCSKTGVEFADLAELALDRENFRKSTNIGGRQHNAVTGHKVYKSSGRSRKKLGKETKHLGS